MVVQRLVQYSDCHDFISELAVATHGAAGSSTFTYLKAQAQCWA